MNENNNLNARLKRFRRRSFSNVMRSAEFRRGIVDFARDSAGEINGFRIHGYDRVFQNFEDAANQARVAGLNNVSIYDASTIIGRGRNAEFIEGSSTIREFARTLVTGDKFRKDNYTIITRDQGPTTEFKRWLEKNMSTAFTVGDTESNKVIQVFRNGQALKSGEAFKLFGEVTNMTLIDSDKWSKRFRQFSAEKQYEQTLAGINITVTQSYKGQEGFLKTVRDQAREEYKALSPEHRAKYSAEQYVERRVKEAAYIASDGSNYAGRNFAKQMSKMTQAEIDRLSKLSRSDDITASDSRKLRTKIRQLQKDLGELDSRISKGQVWSANFRASGAMHSMTINLESLKQDLGQLAKDGAENPKSKFYEAWKDLKEQIEKMESMKAFSVKGDIVINPGDTKTTGIISDIQNVNFESARRLARGKIIATLSVPNETKAAVLDLETASTWSKIVDPKTIQKIGERNFSQLVSQLEEMKKGGPPPPQFWAMVEQMERSMDLSTVTKGKRLRKIAEMPGSSLASDPNILQSAMTNLVESYIHKPGQAKIEIPGSMTGHIIQASSIPENAAYSGKGTMVRDVLKDLKKAGKGHARMVSGLGWIVGNEDPFSMYTGGGGFDFDDAFVGAARWHRGSAGQVEMILPFLRRPNSRGEYSLLKTAIHDMSVLDSLRNAQNSGQMEAKVFDTYNKGRKTYIDSTKEIDAYRKGIARLTKEKNTIRQQRKEWTTPWNEKKLREHDELLRTYDKRILTLKNKLVDSQARQRGSQKVMEGVVTGTDIFGTGQIKLDPRRIFFGAADPKNNLQPDAFKNVGSRYGLADEAVQEYTYQLSVDISGQKKIIEGKNLRFANASGEAVGKTSQRLVGETSEEFLQRFAEKGNTAVLEAVEGLLGQSVNADIFLKSTIAKNEAFLRANGLERFITSTAGFEQEALIDALVQTGLDPKYREAVIQVRRQNIDDALEAGVAAVAKAKQMAIDSGADISSAIKDLGIDSTYFEEGRIPGSDRRRYEKTLKRLLDHHKLTIDEVATEGVFSYVNTLSKDFKELTKDDAITSGFDSSFHKTKIAAEIRASKEATRDARMILDDRKKFVSEMKELADKFGISDRGIYQDADRRTLAAFGDLFEEAEDGGTRAGRRAFRAVIRAAQMIDNGEADIRALRALGLGESPVGRGIDLMMEAVEYAKSEGAETDFDRRYLIYRDLDRYSLKTSGGDIADQTGSLTRRQTDEVLRRILEGTDTNYDFLKSMTLASEYGVVHLDGPDNAFRGALAEAGLVVDDGEKFMGPLSPETSIRLGSEFDKFYDNDLYRPGTMGELIYDYSRGREILDSGDDRIMQTRLRGGVRRDFEEFERSVVNQVRQSMEGFTRAAVATLDEDSTSSATYASHAQAAMRDSGLDPERYYGKRAEREAREARRASQEVVEDITQKKGFGGLAEGLINAGKPIKSILGAAAAGLVATGVIRTMKDDDHTLDDMQGEYGRPGGNPYTEGQEAERISLGRGLRNLITGEKGSVKAVRYVVRSNQSMTDARSQEFLREVASITGQSVNVTNDTGVLTSSDRFSDLDSILSNYR